MLDVELGRRAEVALAPGCELDLAADPRDAEGADVLAVEVPPDDVPDAVVGEEGVRVERPLGDLVARDRPVLELDGALLRDCALELREPARHLRGVVGVEHLDAARRLGQRLGEPGPAEGEVLEREPQRLGVGELALEQVQRGLERRELLVLELELRQEVLLGAKRVQLLAGELVALGLERHAEREQFCAVGVEAACERLVGHLGVALDVRLDVAGRQRPPLRHQERDQRELANQLVRVVRHPRSHPTRQCLWIALVEKGCARPRPSPRASLRGAGATGSSRVPAAAYAGRACPCASSRGTGRRRRRGRRTRSAPR